VKYEFQDTCQIPKERLNRIFTEAFGWKNDGVLVEVGAYDGWHWSCTWGLAKSGWRSLYFEPVADLFRQCVSTFSGFPNTRVINCCIGDYSGTVTLGMCDYGASFSSKVGAFEVGQLTLDQALQDNGIPEGFDLLVVDVEGYEENVLAGFTIEKWRPKVIIIERPPEPNKITQFGYVTKFKDWINTVYVRP